MKVADFGFNMWGYESPDSPNSLLEGAVDRRVAALLGLEVVRSPLISEGGSREFNGRGVMLAVEAVERQRKPGLDPRGDGGGVPTGARRHEDRLAGGGHGRGRAHLPRAAPRRGLYGHHHRRPCGRVRPLRRPRNHPARRGLRGRAASRPHRRHQPPAARREFPPPARGDRRRGQPLPHRPRPGPGFALRDHAARRRVFDYIQPLAYEDGSTIAPDDEIRVIAAAATSTSRSRTGLVLAQKYWKPGMPESLREKDERALAILREVFPGREVVALDAMAVNLGGGGIHCVLQQEPLPEPLPEPAAGDAGLLSGRRRELGRAQPRPEPRGPRARGPDAPAAGGPPRRIAARPPDALGRRLPRRVPREHPVGDGGTGQRLGGAGGGALRGAHRIPGAGRRLGGLRRTPRPPPADPKAAARRGLRPSGS